MEWTHVEDSAIYERLRKCQFDKELLIKIKKDKRDLTDTEKVYTLIAKGDLERLKIFIPNPPEGCEHRSFNKVVNEHNQTLVHIAAHFGHVDIVEFLLSQGFKVDPIDILERTPLHYAALTGDCVEILLKNKADHLIQDNLYRTPCHYAAMSGDLETVKQFLIKERKLVTAKDSFERTLLHYVV